MLRCSAVSSKSIAASALLLGFQLGVVRLEEGADVVGHVEQARPLLFVERDREAAQPVHRHAPLLAHLQRHAARGARLEGGHLRAQSLDLRLHVLVSHGALSSAARYTAARTCSRTKRMMSCVEVPGVNSSFTPTCLRAAMSSGGMIPPPNTTTSSAPFSRSSSSTRLNR